MDLLTNGLLIAATLFAGGYCWVLARRVRDLKSLDSGLGGAIVTLTRQVELARTTLDEARATSRDTRQDLTQLIAKADGAAGQLRLLIAAAPVAPPAPPPRQAAPEPTPEPVTVAPESVAASAQAVLAPVIAIRPVAQAHPEPATRTPHLTDVPKPRALAPIENPLRRKEHEVAPAPSEDDILEALSALAGGD